MNSNSTPLLRISHVCDLLRPEFPDISISKLRFLEEKELVRPKRTPGGYRMYSHEHVRQLRHVLLMQRDEFMPLRVIRDELKRRLGEDGEGGAAATPSPRRDLAAVAASRVALTAREQYLTYEQLCDRAQVTPEFVDECRRADIVEGMRSDDGTLMFSSRESGIVRAAGQMQKLGVDLRHARQVRAVAGRMAGLVEQYGAARLRVRNTDERAAAVRNVEALTEAMSEFVRLAFVRDVRDMTVRGVAASAGSPSGGAAAASLITSTTI